MKSKYLTVTILSASLLFTGCASNTETGTAVPVFEPVEIEEEAQPEIIEEESVEEEEPAETEEPIEEEPIEESEEDLGYTIIDIDEVTMFATGSANIRNFPSAEDDNTIVGSLSYAQEVTAIGKVEKDGKIWFVLSTSGEGADEKQMVSGGLLSESKPAQQQQAQTSGGGSAQQPSGGGGENSQKALEDLASEFGATIVTGGRGDQNASHHGTWQ